MKHRDSLWKGKVIKGPVISVLPQGRRVDMSLKWDSERVFLALSAESKLLLVGLFHKCGERWSASFKCLPSLQGCRIAFDLLFPR